MLVRAERSDFCEGQVLLWPQGGHGELRDITLAALLPGAPTLPSAEARGRPQIGFLHRRAKEVKTQFWVVSNSVALGIYYQIYTRTLMGTWGSPAPAVTPNRQVFYG